MMVCGQVAAGNGGLRRESVLLGVNRIHSLSRGDPSLVVLVDPVASCFTIHLRTDTQTKHKSTDRVPLLGPHGNGLCFGISVGGP